MLCSLQAPCILPSKVRKIRKIGTSVYTLSMVVIWICVMLTFPGYVNNGSTEQYLDWYYGPFYLITNFIWLIITFSSTVVTIFAVCKIFSIAKELQSYNENVSINKNTMILHAILLTIQSLASLLAATYPYIPLLAAQTIIIDITLTVVEVIVQLMICFICLTMGSHEHLRKFKMTLDFSRGAPRIVFNRISVTESPIEVYETIGDESRQSSVSSES